MSNIISSSKQSIECVDVTIEPELCEDKEKVSWFDKTNSIGDTNLKSLAIASLAIYNFGSLMSTLKRLLKQ